MLVNSTLAKDLLEAWRSDQNRKREDRGERVIPSQQEFEIFLDTMFQATLLKEENENVSASVAWISKEDFLKYEVPKYRATELCFCFRNLIEFTAKNLAKLSGVSNGKTSVLLACMNNGSPKVWGVCYFQRELEPLGHNPAVGDFVRHFAPDCPTITTKGIGSLEITRGTSRIGRVENGQFRVSHVDALSYDMAGKFLLKPIGIQIVPGSRHYKDSDEAEVARSYLSLFEYLVEILSQRKQGAAIIIVPDEEKARKYFDSSWEITGSLEMDVLQDNRKIYQHAKEPIAKIFRLKIAKTLSDRLRNIIDLAKMDGALLLTPDLNVLAFGAKLKADKWQGTIKRGIIPNSDTTSRLIDFARLGTRHNSALNFVAEVDGAVAFVASSDGPIRVITKDLGEDAILYWPDCRETMSKQY
jgi:DNA integrity scanning protein DisA with diadenylate cyclase activity